MVAKCLYFLIFLVNLCKSEDYFIGYARSKIEALKTKNDFSHLEENTEKCLKDLFQYLDDLENRRSWAIFMNEAGANYIKPNELLQGTWDQGRLTDYGFSYQRCLNLQHEHISGSYCIMNLYIDKFLEKQPVEIQKSDHVQHFLELYKDIRMNVSDRWFHSSMPTRLRLAACVPDSCTPETLNELDLLPDVTEVAHCHTQKQLEEYRSLNTLDWCFIIFVASIVVVVIFSTYKRFFQGRVEDGRVSRALHSFNLIDNVEELFGLSGSQKNSIACLDGCRAMAIITEMCFHLLYMNTYLPISNFKGLQDVYFQPVKIFLMQSHVAVDTFYVMGGILMAYNFLKTHNSTYGVHFSSLRHYLNRYLRITPAIAAVLFFQVTLFRITPLTLDPPGPLWHEDPKGDGLLNYFVGDCRRNSWAILLHLQNIFYPYNMCIEQLWYMGTDFQATLISPLILLYMAKKTHSKRRKLTVLILLAGLASSTSLLIYWSYGWNGYQIKSMTTDTFTNMYYTNPLTKIYPWVVGLVFGFLLFHSATNRRLNQWLSSSRNRYILWVVSGPIIVFCFWGILILPDQDKSIQTGSSAFLHALYAMSYRLIWAVMLGMNIYNFQVIVPEGIGNKFMTNPFFQYLAKISFSIYVSHMTICFLRQRSLLGSTTLHETAVIVEAIGIQVVDILVGTILYLGIELPFSKLVRIFLPEKKFSKPEGEKNGADMKSKLHKL